MRAQYQCQSFAAQHKAPGAAGVELHRRDRGTVGIEPGRILDPRLLGGKRTVLGNLDPWPLVIVRGRACLNVAAKDVAVLFAITQQGSNSSPALVAGLNQYHPDPELIGQRQGGVIEGVAIKIGPQHPVAVIGQQRVLQPGGQCGESVDLDIGA